MPLSRSRLSLRILDREDSGSEELGLRNRRKASAMNRTGAMLAESGKMIGRWIAFVFGKSVGRIFPVEFQHRSVPLDLGDDARGGDAEAAPVPSDERRVRAGEIRDRQAVDQGVGRSWSQGEKRLPHCPVRGPEDVPAVDLEVVEVGGGPAHLGVCGQRRVKVFPFCRRQLLRVVEARKPEALRQHDRRRHDRPGPRAAPGFVQPATSA